MSKSLELENVVNQIFNEKTDIGSPFTMVELANSVESLATDIYSENKRFIYELIQNADDAGIDDNAELSIDLLANYVIISHNGEPFSHRDLRGLCSIGIGTKSNDAEKTGYKGIGFKSVFGQPDGVVYVKTNDTLFRFDRDFASEQGWNPIWGNKEEWERENSIQFNCPWQMMPILSNIIDDGDLQEFLNNDKYTVKTAIKIRDENTIYNDIIGLFEDAKFMLFLRKIKSVHLNYNDTQIHLEKVKHKDILEVVTLRKNEKLLSNWYVKNWRHDIPSKIQEDLKLDLKTPKKIQNMIKTEISFAFKLNENYDEIELLNENESPIYSYLPTSVKEYNLPFVVNCNFLLDAGREKIHKNRIWNEWLFQVIGYKTIQCCEEFVRRDLFSTTYLSFLRNGYQNSLDNLSKKIDEGLRIGLNEFAFIKNNKSELCKLNEIYIDPYRIIEIDESINGEVAKYLNSLDAIGVRGDNIILISEQNKVLKKYNPKIFNETLLQGFFASNYIRNFIKVENNFKVLQFIKPFEEKDPSGKWYITVANHPLILNQESVIDYIKGVCFPLGISIEDNAEYQNRLIHEDVFNSIKLDEGLIKWLEKLGVSEPGSVAYLEKEIIDNIDNCITNQNYLEVTKFIFDLHASGSLEDRHYVDLQELPLKTNRGLKKANQCVLSDKFNPTIDFRKFLNNLNAVSEEYLEIASPYECKEFFKLLNVIDDVDFIKSSKKLASELRSDYVVHANTFAKQGHQYPHLIGFFHPNPPTLEVSFYLQSFSFLDNTVNINFAKEFWIRIFEKYRISYDKSAVSAANYGPSRDYKLYNLSDGNRLKTLDSMNWGRILSNKVDIPNYFFWYIENTKCIPTTSGMSLPVNTFVNSDYNNEVGGDFLPILNLNKLIPEDWKNVLKLKSRFSLKDLLIVLYKLSNHVNSNASLSKENQKRLGLVYNDLLKRIEIDKESAVEEIKEWSKTHRLISSSKNSLSPEDLIWIKVPGFENLSAGIDTIYLPQNVNKNDQYFEVLLRAFGVPIIEQFSYKADNQNEFYDLKIKLLHLLGPIALVLKDRMQITDIDRFIYESSERISKTKFIKCNNLRPVFSHDSENIEGDPISFYYDKNNDEFLLTIEWNNPISLLSLSYNLSSLISAVKVEKELMVLLLLNRTQIFDYLTSVKLDYTEYEACESYKDTLLIIEEIEEISKPITKYVSKPLAIIDVKSKKEEEVIDSVSEDILRAEVSLINNSVDKSNNFIYTEEEISQIKSLFGGELPVDELEEENLYAQIKALRYYKDKDFNTSGAEANFEKNYDDKYLYPIIDVNGKAFKVMCRSARRGILFFGTYAWNSLGETNTLLYILTGDKSSDCVVVKNQEELETKLYAEYKVLRRKNTSYEELKNLIGAETNLSDLQLLYKVKGSSFDVIFNPQRNIENITEGPLIDIGVDI